MKPLSKSKSEITLGITPGEPAGIGPDLCLASFEDIADTRLIYFTDPALLQARAAELNLDIPFNTLDESGYQTGAMNIQPIKLSAPAQAGTLNPGNGAYVIETLEEAVQACEAGTIDAVVTGPVQKSVINDAGIPFTGHTEWLAERTNTSKVVMMLASGDLRVALATTHLPLSGVSAAITNSSLEETIRILHQDLIDKFGIGEPSILVCGLNPHAGENGHLGREEIEVIGPVLQKLRQESMDLIGPLPADTAFNPDKLTNIDAVLAMYHDQGLPVLKFASFGRAINITLGLPIIRTSVDHGTALDIAGTGKADTSSLVAAIEAASSLAASNLGLSG
ncbi:MAG: 4-hydroxythreonine-4-phosphate dehydrogenase PdxA [Pseudomonadales bacterium]|nr:4-hydroxythreonine-4-phosphate dehydrogenase PdxA [Pseudomonadales bacterium]MBO6564103.1 4-hydroxythreonine-4-phosphate dehydrogenase PdxA [Pseudomonadales bacterium]MBO6597639.1 4-hydroxythreonine-4-phosphate dehydrogenase PdxA [Pseudomonadales bacterium]MBO6823877.1 4-hydroxythreonine-4-phosphate dehydrogenase PdxA [Pseudomonadales bacterium]